MLSSTSRRSRPSPMYRDDLQGIRVKMSCHTPRLPHFIYLRRETHGTDHFLLQTHTSQTHIMAHAQQNLPTRSITNTTDDEAVPDEDTSEVTKLFLERLQAWKHACGYLEDYIEATEKIQAGHHKEYEKALKVRPITCNETVHKLTL